MEWCFAAVKRQFRVIGPSLYTFVIERRRASDPPDERAHPCSREVQLRSREGVPADRRLRRTELVNPHLVKAP